MVFATFKNCSPMAINDDERTFFVQLGARVSEYRKARQITQVQLAEMLDIKQQMIHSYEAGKRRIPASLLPALSQILSVPVDELLGCDTPIPAKRKRGPVSQLQKQMEQIAKLPKTKQKNIKEMLDGLIQQYSKD